MLFRTRDFLVRRHTGDQRPAGTPSGVLRHHTPHIDGRQRVSLEAQGRGHCGLLVQGHQEEEKPTASALAEDAPVGTRDEVSLLSAQPR